MRLFLLAFIVSVCSAQEIQFRHTAVIQAKRSNVESGPSYIVSEDAEGTGTPSGWTEPDGDPNWDGTGLVGSESLVLSADTDDVYYAFSASSDVWAYAVVHLDSIASNPILFGFSNNSSSQARVIFINNGIARVQSPSTTSLASSSTGTVTADTVYHIWLHYVQGTGSDGVVQLYVSTTSTRPGSPTVSSSSGTATGTVNRFYVYGTASTVLSIDTMRVDDEEISSDPP